MRTSKLLWLTLTLKLLWLMLKLTILNTKISEKASGADLLLIDKTSEAQCFYSVKSVLFTINLNKFLVLF